MSATKGRSMRCPASPADGPSLAGHPGPRPPALSPCRAGTPTAARPVGKVDGGPPLIPHLGRCAPLRAEPRAPVTHRPGPPYAQALLRRSSRSRRPSRRRLALTINKSSPPASSRSPSARGSGPSRAGRRVEPPRRSRRGHPPAQLGTADRVRPRKVRGQVEEPAARAIGLNAQRNRTGRSRPPASPRGRSTPSSRSRSRRSRAPWRVDPCLRRGRGGADRAGLKLPVKGHAVEPGA